MLFSVIIPTYNRSVLLQEALESVLAQTIADYEIIVVDDGSTDDTHVVVTRWGTRIRYFQQNNKGPGAARNLGAQNARGQYIAFLDSDDIWLPWALEVVRGCIAAYDSPAMVVMRPSDFHVTDELRKIQREPTISHRFSDYIAAAQKETYSLLTCSSVVLQARDFVQSGGFCEANVNAEDLDFWLRLGAAPGFVEIMSPVGCGYRRHAGSAVASLDKTYAGLKLMLNNERQGIYPGRWNRAAERRKIITRHVRPASLALLRNHGYWKGIDLYWHTVRWHITENRFKYLIGFWWVLLKNFILNTNFAK